MKTILIAIFALTSFSSFAQDTGTEEALILNQEMQFLEDSANNITTNSVRPLGETEIAAQEPTNDSNLERAYFGEEEKDTIRTRTAAPRRRGF